MDQIIIVGHVDNSSSAPLNPYQGQIDHSADHDRNEHDAGPQNHQPNSEDIGGSSVFFPTTEIKTVHITATSHATVTFDPNADHLVTQSLLTAFNSIINSVTNVTRVNVSATTNGHAVDSNHGVGDAVDINVVNGVHIGTSGEGLALATALENAAKADPNVRFVEGPIGNFVRANPGDAWKPSGDLGPSQFTHVHFDVFPKH